MNKEIEKKFDEMIMVARVSPITFIQDIEENIYEIKQFINDNFMSKVEIKEWAEDLVEKQTKIYGTDKHGISLEEITNKVL